MKRSAAELSNISKRYKKLDQITHCHERPDMYVGNTRPERLEWFMPDLHSFQFKPEVFHFSPALGKIADEVLVNSFDNIHRKDSRTKNIKISYNMETGEVTVWNDGATVPVVEHEEHKIPIPTMVFGHTLTGENYNDKVSRLGGGRNGWGAKLTNIFSSKFSIRCNDTRNGQLLEQTWTDNMGKTDGPVLKTTRLKNDFTEVTFVPDWKRFKMDKMNRAFCKYITKRALEMAACSPKDVKVSLNGDVLPINSLEGYAKLYTSLPVTTIRVNKRWEVSVFATDGEDCIQMPSFVNGICTSRGGKHVEHAMAPVYRYLADLATKKVKGINVRPRDVSTFSSVIVSSLIVNPSFDSQTKELLKTPVSEFGSKCDWKDSQLKKFSKSGILEKVEQWAIRKAGHKLQQKVKSKSRLGIPKLYDANKAGTTPDKSLQCWCILTEGDSALTTALSGLEIVGRDFFGAFPLKGKLLNVRDAGAKALLANKEIQNICKILGLVPGQAPNEQQMRYGHVCVMADQDHDGSHIKGLLFNLLDTFWPSLLERPGYVQVFHTPIVKVKHKQQEWVYYSLQQYEEAKLTPPWPSTAKHKHYKGLGTSTHKEAKEYFKKFDEHVVAMEFTDQDKDHLDLAFRKSRARDRREWLSDIPEDAGMLIPHNFTDFVNHELILFSQADNFRSLPSVWDGLKTSQRKVLWAAFKRNLNAEVRVAQFAGYVSEHAAYHHGEMSLNSTIMGLAQNYVGGNNCPLFVPAGQFGSRLQGGHDSASPRYVSTHLQKYARDIFMAEDDSLLTKQFEDAVEIEPEYYAPILPWVLINGSVGIGTGYSCQWPQHDVVDVIDHLLGQKDQLKPHYKGFTGTVRYDNDLKQIHTTGRYTKKGKRITVTELPIGEWTQHYSEFLHKQSFVSKIVEKSTPTKVHFEFVADVPDDQVVQQLKLEKKRPVTLTGFGMDGKIKTYKHVREVIEDWVPERLKIYERRRLSVISTCNANIQLTNNKVRFIESVIRGQIKPQAYNKKSLVHLLQTHQFEHVEQLISMPMYSMTTDEIAKLKAISDSWELRKKEYVSLNAKELWFRDLRKLKSKITT